MKKEFNTAITAAEGPHGFALDENEINKTATVKFNDGKFEVILVKDFKPHKLLGLMYKTMAQKYDNKEIITVENGSTTPGNYSMGVNLIDLKSVLDSCKNEHITMNCGNRKSIIINRGTISNVIAETRTKE